ncbi:MAG TPA: hypothetical protein VJW73_16470 [Gemmatimonadaceae bacterium]|nr:hypothetical protein [Gemmatimonadaceae bacterium]
MNGYRSHLVVKSAMTILFVSMACRRPEPEQISPSAQARWASDSADYVRRLDRWLRDSTVIDSIVRTINTDSLRSLYRAAWTLPQAAPAVQEIVCEQARLALKHGHAAVGIVQRRIEGEEWSPDQRLIDRHMGQRLPHATAFELSNERCHLTGSPAPDSLNGTPLDFVNPRPTPLVAREARPHCEGVAEIPSL